MNLRILIYGVIALAITGGSLLYSNLLVRRLSEEEEGRMKFWAESQDFIWGEHPDYEECEVNFLFTNVAKTNELIPTIMVDSASGKIEAASNLNLGKIPEADSIAKVKSLLEKIRSNGSPAPLHYSNFGKTILVYYDESHILKQLRAFPYLVLLVIAAFITIIFLGFVAAQRGEQNKVWVGMAKETAHQLGTPVSSLMAWVELLELRISNNPNDAEMVTELRKDVDRLRTITERFSKIGSTPELSEQNLPEMIREFGNYAIRRVSRGVKVNMDIQVPEDAIIRVNRSLFEWVIENLLKNAIDAIPGEGSINITVTQTGSEFIFDVQDTGKGIPRSQFRKVFKPGFTTKKRGWGLGLSLSKRIVESYHRGKIFVKHSEVNKGTTFRVIIPR